jgi:hypothetical protein
MLWLARAARGDILIDFDHVAAHGNDDGLRAGLLLKARLRLGDSHGTLDAGAGRAWLMTAAHSLPFLLRTSRS